MTQVEEITQQDFRDGMALLGSAVNVMTTNGPAGKCGFTGTAVCSVTDTPPTLLVCLNKSSAMNSVFQDNGVLCVNVLRAGARELCEHFAGQTDVTMEARFEWDIWQQGITGAPILSDALVGFDCVIEEVKEIGTHSVFFCAVKHIHQGPAGQALIYYGRDYCAA